MSSTAFHPDDETLRLFAVGRLDDDQEDEVNAHLADCEPCSRRLDEIERKKSDPFIREMKATGKPEPSDDFMPGSLLGGHFRLENRLGRGGMGEAWKAFDETAGRPVVLKFVPKDVQHVTEAMNAVLESFRCVHALQHSHICPHLLLDNDPEYGFFLVMKFVDGLPLDAYHRRHDPIPFDEVIRILRDVADALDYAHEKKVIHRDVKPANIMVGETDGVQLIDFGLADEIRGSLTRIEDVSDSKTTGTRSYMAPEQWRGGKLDARTDQYALAVTAYELLAGHVPFSGNDMEVLKNAVLHDPPSPIPGLSGHVNGVLFKGLAKNRSDRFASCKAFIEALAKPYYISTEPPRLPPPLPSIKPKRAPWKSMPTTLRIGSVLILSIVAFFVIRHFLLPITETDVRVDKKQPIAAVEKPAIEPSSLKNFVAETLKRSEPPATEKAATLLTKDDFLFSRHLAAHRNERSGLRKVIRVTMAIDDERGVNLIVKRGLSAEEIGVFRGTRFDSEAFPGVMAFRGADNSVRYLFPNGDVSRQNFRPPLTGWTYSYSGGAYDLQQEKTRFSLKGDGNIAGFIIGKKGSELPCVVTFEVLDNQDNLPYFEAILHKPRQQYTLACWGEKDKDGRPRMNATCTKSVQENPVFFVKDVVVEESMTLVRQFDLPFGMGGKIDMVEYRLPVPKPTEQKKSAGFDLTLFDMIGRFKTDVGEW